MKNILLLSIAILFYLPVTSAFAAGTFYIGSYMEVDDPNDPFPGVIFMMLPSGNSSFNGQFFFSYTGCDGSYDIGNISGSKSSSSISGKWNGDIDGLAINGDFSGSAQPDGSYSGTWKKSGGFVKTPCFTIAGGGTFILSPIDKGNMTISIDSSKVPPVFSFANNEGAANLQVDVFNKGCLDSGGSISSCHMWQKVTLGGEEKGSITYGEPDGNTLAKPLQSGKEYVVSMIDVFDGSFYGSASFVAK